MLVNGKCGAVRPTFSDLLCVYHDLPGSSAVIWLDAVEAIINIANLKLIHNENASFLD